MTIGREPVELAEGRKVPLSALPAPAAAIAEGADLDVAGSTLTVRFEFDRDGAMYRGGVSFGKVRAHRWRAESYCTPWHIDGAYSVVVEVVDSAWVAELLAAEPSSRAGDFVTRHFMVYVDGDGCFEAVADTWAFLPEKRAG